MISNVLVLVSLELMTIFMQCLALEICWYVAQEQTYTRTIYDET
jgi:hypothetical protein